MALILFVSALLLGTAAVWWHYLAVAANEGDSRMLDRHSLASLPVAHHNPEWTVYRLIGAPARPTARRESR